MRGLALCFSCHLLVQVFAGCPNPLAVESNIYYKAALKTCNVTTLATITPANDNVLCTPGCKAALEKISQDYSTCNPQIKPCSATKGIKACSVNPLGVFEKKCPANSKCSVQQGEPFPTKIEEGDCSCTSSSTPCWSGSSCVENPDKARHAQELALIAKARGYATLDAECSADQLQCCPGKTPEQCLLQWCDGFFTPACISKDDWCYSQTGLAIGAPLIVLMVIAVIVVIIYVLNRAASRRWGAAGTDVDVNNPARFM